MTADLFAAEPAAPLADRLRPRTLADVVGQDALLAPDAPIARMLAQKRLASIILWGPPGSGKTTIARLVAEAAGLTPRSLSAVFAGVADLRKAFDQARADLAQGRRTALFIDEIHRFNRAQQDALLPVVEEGVVTLIGATTENPSFALNSALLSRAQVLTVARLEDDALETLLRRAETDRDRPAPLTDHGRAALRAMADGDGRALLTLADEVLSLSVDTPLDAAAVSTRLQRRAPIYDRAQDAHYNLISALHKALRGSDVDAALYWFARMLAGGEDPRYIGRRLVRFASEDIGLADPTALPATTAACEAFERLGSPEGELALAQAVAHLATAPKSNAVYVAFKAAAAAARETGSLPPPAIAVNAPTRLMKDLGYGDGYRYDHDALDAFAGQNFFPDAMPRRQFYDPPARGHEREIAKRLAWWAERRGGGS